LTAAEGDRYSEGQAIQEIVLAVRIIQLGQVWRSDSDGQDYLVTKVYNEVFSQYAVLRRAGIDAPDAPTVRVKVARDPKGSTLPGYTFTQEGAF
jgi:hypothetical protein